METEFIGPMIWLDGGSHNCIPFTPMPLPLLFLVLVVCVVSTQAQTPSTTGPQPQYQFKRSDVTEPAKLISFDLPITCTAQKVAVAGYGMDGFPRGYAGINDPKSQGGLYEDVHVAVDAEPSTWKITVQGDKADVVLGSGSGNTTETWVVVSKTDEYLILLRTDLGKQVRTTTINGKYGTFVHCFNGEFSFVNHGAVVWGTCSN
jgi:hypothetical protein